MVPKEQAEDALRLSLAMVESSFTPLLLVDGELRLLCASASFCSAFKIESSALVGATLVQLGEGEWAVPQLQSLLKATAAGHAEIDAYQMDLKREGQDTRCLLINAQKLNYGKDADVRLLVAIQDVTDQRASEKQQRASESQKDDLLREKAILLQELQHRVANSLQIIASVLMQSARTAATHETKHHLFAAHNRVMSLAAVQDHLTAARLGQVALKPYFASLCESIGASMIRDHTLIAIEVNCDESSVLANASVSLGLIVTELVINSLKHAFPGGRAGKIEVDYRSQDQGWLLRVSDNGIGMPEEAGGAEAKAGLGTTIVRSLAEQLEARVEVVTGNPGTRVSIVHSEQNSKQPAEPLLVAV